MTNDAHLRSLGWDDDVAAVVVPLLDEGRLTAGRIVRVDRGEVDVATGPGAHDVVRASSTTAAKDAVAGDWAALDAAQGRVEDLAPRLTAFVRRAARGARSAQTLAANMDVVLVVQALDPGLNPRRLERELVLAHQSGATPVVVLTKTDLVDEATVAESVATAGATAPGVEVVAVSNRTGEGIGDLGRLVEPGRTFALLGSSGVGKSTLVNTFAGERVQLEGEIREGDGKGRHTTTAARLLILRDGRLLLDTPGVRALALWESWEGLADTFPEIEETAEDCQFADCFHDNEPGCAVIAAAERGDIDPERLENWRRLREEMDELDTHLVDRQRREARTGRPPVL
jgi:ribosome biogenesis GTPase